MAPNYANGGYIGQVATSKDFLEGKQNKLAKIVHCCLGSRTINELAWLSNFQDSNTFVTNIKNRHVKIAMLNCAGPTLFFFCL